MNRRIFKTMQLQLPIKGLNNKSDEVVFDNVLNFYDFKEVKERERVSKEKKEILAQIVESANEIEWLYSSEIKEG